METTELISSENRRRTLADDPQYFGAYLNLARLNIFGIINHLAEQFKVNTLPEDGFIQSGFICESNKKDFNYNWMFEKLIRLMPVVKQFDASRLPEEERKTNLIEGKDLIKMAATLKAVFKDVQEFRNDYTHYYSTDKGTTRKLTVSSETATFLKISFRRAIEYSKARFVSVFTDEDYQLISKRQLVTEGNTVTTEGLVFLTCMFLDRENAFQFIGKIQGLKGTQFKSFVATREVMMAYCVRLPHDKLISDDPQQALLLDMLNELDRCPKVLYDVLSEEAKKDFSPLLTDDAIEQVLANSVNDEMREEFLDNLNYMDYIEQLTLRVRHSNRFYYYAMRFIDEKNLLPDFFFQIDLGKYILADYPKKVLNEDINRIIVENAKAFGRLNSFDAEETVQNRIDPKGLCKGFEQFAPHYNADINKIGFAFQQEICGIESVEAKPGKKLTVNMVQPQPMGFLSLHELQKIILLEYLQPGESKRLIKQFWDTANSQLFSISFIDEIKAQLPQDWKVFWKQTDTKKAKAYAKPLDSKNELLKRKETLDTVLAPYGLNRKQIPERMLNYWLNINDVNESRSVSERILLMRRDAMKRLKQLKKHLVNPETEIPRVGDMATFIARDIVDMIIDKNVKQKITSVYYDKMQECLAFYAVEEKKQQFIALVRELNLNSQGGHPFLRNMHPENIRKTSEFYQKYLEEKVEKKVEDGFGKNGKPKFRDISWMIRTFESKEWSEKANKNLTAFKLPDNKSGLPYTIRQWVEKEQYDLKAWLHNINKGRTDNDLKRPVDLPTNLFDERLCQLLADKLKAAGQEVAAGAKYNELLKRWWQTRDDSPQLFYQGNRCYIIKDEQVCFVPGSEAHFKAYYDEPLHKAFKRLSAQRRIDQQKDRRLPDIRFAQVEKTFKHTLAETEKQIRILSEQDCMVLLMAEQLSPGKGAGHIKLNNIKNELETPRETERTFAYRPDTDAQGNRIHKGEVAEPVQLTVKATMKLKNINDLNRFAHDRRLPGMTAYIPYAAISVDDLRYELTDYNQARQMVFDTVFALEKVIIAKEPEAVARLFTDKAGHPQSGNIQHKPYVSWLQANGFISDTEREYLETVRNSFSHNQFPPYPVISRSQQINDTKKIASQIAEAYKNKMDEIISRINQ